MANNRKWIGLYALVIFLWAIVFFTLSRVLLSYQPILVDSRDISLITTPLVIFNLVFVASGIFISSLYLVLYTKAVKRQKYAIKNFQTVRLSKLHNDVRQLSLLARQRSPSGITSVGPIKKYEDQKFRDDLCSIIIPAHNEETVIINTIKNCLLQTYQNIEIIVVCHNCKDDTYARSKEVSDNRVNSVNFSTKESGKGIALNHGVSMAKGEYLLILDGDGKLNNTFIEDAMAMFYIGNYAAVQGRYVPSNRGFNFITRMLAIEGDLWSTPFMTVRSIMGNRTPLGGTGYIIKKSILIEAGGFSNDLVDDYELSFRLFRKKHRITFAPLSVNYDEKPPSLNMMFNQRGRWVRGFLNLTRFRIAEPRDIIGNLYTLNSFSGFTNFILLFISGFSTMYYLGFHYYPFHFSYISPTIWIELTATILFLNIAVLVRQYGSKGLRYAVFLPLYLFFSNYYLVTFFKAFFIKSWAESKTIHGFLRENVLAPKHASKEKH